MSSPTNRIAEKANRNLMVVVINAVSASSKADRKPLGRCLKSRSPKCNPTGLKVQF
jgi:hypothetical protein